jgi:ribonuclease HI
MENMVHAITDGGANQNPGNAGWLAMVRQNGRCTYNFGHYDHASNNAMRIRAVVEALRILQEGMHVCVSTDSAYVKKGITEWIPKWVLNRWCNSKGVAVANKTLWQELIVVTKRIHMIEWSWVKVYRGILLNECADMVATKGVKNEQPPAIAQFAVPMGRGHGYRSVRDPRW